MSFSFILTGIFFLTSKTTPSYAHFAWSRQGICDIVSLRGACSGRGKPRHYKRRCRLEASATNWHRQECLCHTRGHSMQCPYDGDESAGQGQTATYSRRYRKNEDAALKRAR